MSATIASYIFFHRNLYMVLTRHWREAKLRWDGQKIIVGVSWWEDGWLAWAWLRWCAVGHEEIHWCCKIVGEEALYEANVHGSWGRWSL